MFSHEILFDIKYNIDKDKFRFTSILYCYTIDKDCGEIQGSIEREDGLKIFTIDTSEVNDEFVSTGIGFKFYVQTIKKSFELGCDEFRASTCRNENSEKLWQKIQSKFYNVEKYKKYYRVTLPLKDIL